MLTKDSLMDRQTSVPNTTRLVGVKSAPHFVSLNGMLQL